MAAGSASQVARNADGRLEVFCACVFNHRGLQHTWQLWPGGPWSPWTDLSDLSGTPVAVVNVDGRLEVFGRNAAGVAHQWQLAPNGPWSGVEQLASDTSATGLAVARDGDGRLHAFFQGCGCATPTSVEPFVHVQQLPSGGWGPGAAMSASPLPVGQATAFTNVDGSVELLTFSSTDSQHDDVYDIRFTTSGVSTDHSAFPPIPSPATPQAAINADGRAEELVLGAHRWQVSPGGPWSEWADLPSRADFLDGRLSRNADGRLEVFTLHLCCAPHSSEVTVEHAWQVAPGSDWSAPASFASTTSWTSPLGVQLLGVTDNLDGRLEVFGRVDALASETTVPFPVHAWQTQPSSGPWPPPMGL